MLSSEIPSSDAGFLLIERRGTALTFKELTQEPLSLSFPASFLAPHKMMGMYAQQPLTLWDFGTPLNLRQEV